MHVAVDGAGGQEVGMVGREVDVRDGPGVALQGVLDGAVGRVLPMIQVPDEAAVVGRGGDPVVAGGEGRPLHVDHEPRESVAADAPRRTEGGI